MEQQSLTTLHAALHVAGDPQLEALYHGHVVETERHLELVEERLEAHDASRSLLKDLTGRVSARTSYGNEDHKTSESRWLVWLAK